MDYPAKASASRQLSLCTTMQAVIHCGPISRASIAKQTGLSKQTVSEIIRILEDEGWVRETGRTSGHVGRTATTYELVPDSAFMAAVDLGGTKLRVAIVDLAGTVLSELVEPTDSKGGTAIARQIGRLVRQAADNGAVDLARIRQTVVGCPGVPDQRTGRIHFAPNITGVDAIDFRTAVETELGTPVLLENDVNLAVLGEQWLGAGQGIDHLVFIALGTGVGAGIVVNGALLRGATGAAGELGYLPFGADPFEAESFRVGAFERATATQGIRAEFARLTGRSIDVPAIFDAAAAGDAHAKSVLDHVARHMAKAIAALGAIVAPEVVVLGGSIGARAEIVAATRIELARCFPFPVRVEPSRLGNHAAISGAVAIGLTELHSALFAQSAPGAVVTLPVPKPGLVPRAAE
jgi:predicted NBD/HSP70 family sugar kinase/biotin operon repressor